MTASRILATALLLGCLAGCGGGAGDQATVPQARPAEDTFADIGDHVVHFSAQPTDQLPADIARVYDIVRSRNRAMLTVSVVDKGTNQSVTAAVGVKTQNLTGQLKNVAMREIREPGENEGIYYVGETSIANRETLIFDISVIPEGKNAPSDVRFKREFYTD